MARRSLLTDEERRLLFGIPNDPDALARHYTFTRSDHDFVKRADAPTPTGWGLPCSWRCCAISAWAWRKWRSRSMSSSSGWRSGWKSPPPPLPITPAGRRR